MNRRTFLCGLTFGVLSAPLTIEAQRARAKLAMLLTGTPAVGAPEYAVFTKQLGEFGWIEGQNLVIDRRWADAAEKFVALAVDTVREKPDVMTR